MRLFAGGRSVAALAALASACAARAVAPRASARAVLARPADTARERTAPSRAPTRPPPPLEAALPPAPAPPPAPAAVLYQTAGVLDPAVGVEEITLYADGVVAAGARRGRVEVPAADEYFAQHQGAVSVVVLDRARGLRAVLVALPTTESEDPPNRYQLLLRAGPDLRVALDRTIGAYGVTPLAFPGDGTARYVEDGWSACERAHYPRGSVARDEVRFALGADGAMHEVGRVATRRRLRCSNLSACPFVDVLGPAGAMRVGEILRNVRGAAAYTDQDLPLPAAGAGVLRVRLAEEEAEVTHLDELYLEANGARVLPRACAGDSPPLYCAADRRMLTLRTGESLEVEFELPSAVARPALHARGYYVPTPTAARAGLTPARSAWLPR